MKRRSYTDEDIQFIKDNYRKIPVKEIAKKLDRTPEAIYSIAKKDLKIATKTKPKVKSRAWTDEENEYLINNYAKTKTNEIMNTLNRSRPAIHKQANKLGLEKLTANHDYFKTWTPNMAYVAGLFYADGTMNKEANKISITLHKEDRYLLEKIQCELQSTSSITDITTSNCCVIPIYSAQIKQDLSIMGVTPNKSLTVEMPEIPILYLSHFVRGYFDGDGTIVQSKDNPRVNFTCGSKKFLEQLSRMIEKETGITSKINEKPFKPSKLVTKGNTCYRLYFNGLNALDLGKWLYQEADLLMERKYKKYLEYEELYRDKYMKRIEDIKKGLTFNGGYQLQKSAKRYFE